jgi:integrase
MKKLKRSRPRYSSIDERLSKLINDFEQPETRKLVKLWVDEQIANGRNLKNIITLLYTLHKALNSLKKPIEQIIKDNDKDAVAQHLKSIAVNGKVIRKHKIILKRFFKWVNDGEHPKCTKWISSKKTLDDMKPEIKLLTDEEKNAIIDNALNQRDRTIFSILLENPTRPRDIINLNIEDLIPNEHGYEIRFHSKTQGGFRTVQFIHAAPEIRLYLSGHRWRDDPKSPLFYSYSTEINAVKSPAD